MRRLKVLHVLSLICAIILGLGCGFVMLMGDKPEFSAVFGFFAAVALAAATKLPCSDSEKEFDKFDKEQEETMASTETDGEETAK